MSDQVKLLPPDALAGVRLGISVSQSADLGRLGLSEAHFRLTLGELARLVLVGGGTLAYGGHLRPDGYTTYLVDELLRYGGRTDRPLLICLAWQEHRELPLAELRVRKKALALFGELVCLDVDGNEIDPAAGRGNDPELVPDPVIRKCALTGLRRYLRRRTQGRLVLGGKTHDFQGELPGLMEEVLVALEGPEPQPVYLAGGFGGVTADIVKALRVDDLSWLPPDAGAPPPDPRLLEGHRRLEVHAAAPGWQGLSNGLSADENRRLAATCRPSEVAALVSLGLGRRFAKKT